MELRSSNNQALIQRFQASRCPSPQRNELVDEVAPYGDLTDIVGGLNQENKSREDDATRQGRPIETAVLDSILAEGGPSGLEQHLPSSLSGWEALNFSDGEDISWMCDPQQAVESGSGALEFGSGSFMEDGPEFNTSLHEPFPLQNSTITDQVNVPELASETVLYTLPADLQYLEMRDKHHTDSQTSQIRLRKRQLELEIRKSANDVRSRQIDFEIEQMKAGYKE
ncbi:MAG: hypothetical protein Q9164_007659 [Protoblastenia rupestris]